jgi:O-antigen ligase
MKFQVGHIINTIFLTLLSMVILNAIMFVLFWKGVSIAIPVMVIFCLLGVLLKVINTPVVNFSFQLWSIFIFTFIIISYPATLYYGEVNPTFDMTAAVRIYFYNFIITFTSYQYTLFITERRRIGWFLDCLNLILIVGTLITIFAVPIGLYKIDYAVPPGFMSVTRMAGIYFDPNFAGFAANITAIFSISGLFRPKSPKILGIVGVFVGLLGIIASFSKSGILSLLIWLFTTLIIYFIMYARVPRQTRRVANILFGGFFYIIFQFILFIALNFNTLPKEQRERIQQIENIITGKADKSDTSNRANLVELGLSKVQERPIFGTGYLSFTYLLDAGSNTGDNVGVHNTFLRVWGEAGTFAFLLFIGFWIHLLNRAIQLKHLWQRLLLVALIVEFIVFGLTAHTVLEDNFIGALIGILLALIIFDNTAPPSVSVDILAEK